MICVDLPAADLMCAVLASSPEPADGFLRSALCKPEFIHPLTLKSVGDGATTVHTAGR